VRWYLRFGLSYRDVEELLQGRREVLGFGVGDSEDGAFGPRSCAA
jgi:hypothetical protein